MKQKGLFLLILIIVGVVGILGMAVLFSNITPTGQAYKYFNNYYKDDYSQRATQQINTPEQTNNVKNYDPPLQRERTPVWIYE